MKDRGRSQNRTLEKPLSLGENVSPKMAAPIALSTWWKKKALGMPTLAFLFLLLIAIPELWAFVHPPEGKVYLLSFWSAGDVAPYIAAMKDAASSGSWLVTDRLTPELHVPTLIYPLYVLVAKVAGGISISQEVALVLFLNVSRAFLLWGLHKFVATFVAPAKRRLAFFLILGSGGLAFVWLILGAFLSQPSLVNVLGVEWRYQEFSTFLLLYGYPHQNLAVACLLLIAALWFKYIREGRPSSLVGIVGAVLLLGFANPFSLVPVGAVLGLHVGICGIVRRLGRRQLEVALAFAVGATPFLAFHYLAFAREPFWSTVYGLQNVSHLLTPSLAALLSGFGLVLPLAVVGVAALKKQRMGQGPFLILWVVVLFALMLAPVPYQRRYGLGLHPFLALLAFTGLSALTEHYRWRSSPLVLQILIRDLVFVGLFGSVMGAYLLVAMGSQGLGPLGRSSFESVELIEAGQWLAEHSGKDDVILCDRATGNALVRYVRGRMVYAHDIATLAPEQKREEIRDFYQYATSDCWRKALIKKYAVTIVVEGPRERSLGGFSPGEASYLEEIYKANGVNLYAVLPKP